MARLVLPWLSVLIQVSLALNIKRSPTEPTSAPVFSPQRLLVPSSGNFDQDFDARAKRYEERCDSIDPTNPFVKTWSAAEATKLCNGTLLLSHFFTCKHSFQTKSAWGRSRDGSNKTFDQMSVSEQGALMKPWLDSVKKFGLCAMVFHDVVGERGLQYQKEFGTQKVRFVSVDPLLYDQLLGRNFGLIDLRWQFFQQALCANEAWKFAFYNDLVDVTVARSPIGEAKSNVVYVGTDFYPFGAKSLDTYTKPMGGPYREFWEKNLQQEKHRHMWNAGLVGGAREMVLPFMAKYLAVLTDPEIGVGRHGFLNNNMGGLNYVCERFYVGVCRGDKPLNSRFTIFETNRTDVWFIHKL